MIGILDLQGDVVEHIDHFLRLGLVVRRVRRPDHLDGLSGLVIPGGESTCLLQLIRVFQLDQAIYQAVDQGCLKVWGTCAGAILMAEEVIGEGKKLALMKIVVARNAFGSQLESFQCRVRIARISERELPLTMIRAPKIIRAGKGVEVLLRIDDYMAMVESEQGIATVFHPEMTPCLEFHRYFAKKCGIATSIDDQVPAWNPTSWTRLQGIE